MENTVWDESLLPNPADVDDGEIYFVAKTAKYFENKNNTWNDITYNMLSSKPIIEFIERYNIIQKRGIFIS